MKSSRICRLCLSTKGELETLILSSDISEEIFNCTNIKIRRISGLPDCICELCKSELITSSKFKRKCVQTDEILQKRYPDRFKDADSGKIYSDSAASIESESNIDVEEVEYIEESVNSDYAEENSELCHIAQLLELQFEPLDEVKLAEELQKEKLENGNTYFECENTINLHITRAINPAKFPPQVKEVLQSSHGKQPKYRRHIKCTICGKFQLNMTQHMLVHSDFLPFRCPYCNHGFRQHSNLKHHVYIHTGEKPYQCTYQLCDKAFSDPASLRSHKVRHTGERRYQCEYCNKAFGYSHTLAAHRRIHTQDRKHKCGQCSKAFLSKYALSKHMRSHTGERPYNCSKCLKRFATSGNLSVHQRVHTKEQPYRCNFCGQQFSYKCVLNTHMKKHIREQEDSQEIIPST